MPKQITIKGNWVTDYVGGGVSERIARGVIDGRKPVEIRVVVPADYGSLRFGWEERARILAERQLNAQPQEMMVFLFLDAADVEAVES